MNNYPRPKRCLNQLLDNWNGSKGHPLALDDCKCPTAIRRNNDTSKANTMRTFLTVELIINQGNVAFVENLTVKAFQGFKRTRSVYQNDCGRTIGKELFESIRSYLAIIRPMLFEGHPSKDDDIVFSSFSSSDQTIFQRGITLFENWSASHLHPTKAQFEESAKRA